MFFTETVFFFSSEPLFLLDVKKWVLVFFQILSKFVNYSFGSDYLFLTSFGLIIVFYKILLFTLEFMGMVGEGVDKETKENKISDDTYNGRDTVN